MQREPISLVVDCAHRAGRFAWRREAIGVEGVGALEGLAKASFALLDELRGNRQILVLLEPGRGDVDDRAVAFRVERRCADVAALQHEADRFARAAATRVGRGAVPQRQQHVAMRGDVDARLAVAKVATWHNRLLNGCHEHVGGLCEERFEQLRIGAGEVLSVLVGLEWQRAYELHSQRKRFLSAERIGACRQGVQHREFGVRACRLQLRQLCAHGFPELRDVLFPQVPMPRDPYDNRCSHAPIMT